MLGPLFCQNTGISPIDFFKTSNILYVLRKFPRKSPLDAKVFQQFLFKISLFIFGQKRYTETIQEPCNQPNQGGDPHGNEQKYRKMV